MLKFGVWVSKRYNKSDDTDMIDNRTLTCAFARQTIPFLELAANRYIGCLGILVISTKPFTLAIKKDDS
jgi:hypothetical protein